MSDIDLVKSVRKETGISIKAIREAIEEVGKDKEKILSFLRKKGIAKAKKREAKHASEGILGTYNHGNKVVVVVEVNCETDFASQGDSFKKFANDMALHVAASNPLFIDVEAIPKTELKKVKETFEKDLKGKPDNVKKKILEGKLDSYYTENVLMRQPFFLDDTKSVEDYYNELVVKVGEKIVIKSFTRVEVGKEIKVVVSK